jgi:GRASP55/65 PDZ-like domain
VRDASKNHVAASVMVYSTATGRVRNVEILPNSNWGGEGILGCELATGLLHRVTREGPKT